MYFCEFSALAHTYTHTHTHKRSTLNVLLVAKFSTASVRFSFVSLNGAKSVGTERQNTRATKLGNGRNYSRRKLHTFYYQRQLSKLQLQAGHTTTGRENATCHTAFLTNSLEATKPQNHKRTSYHGLHQSTSHGTADYARAVHQHTPEPWTRGLLRLRACNKGGPANTPLHYTVIPLLPVCVFVCAIYVCVCVCFRGSGGSGTRPKIDSI